MKSIVVLVSLCFFSNIIKSEDWEIKYGHLISKDEIDKTLKEKLRNEGFNFERLIEFIRYLKPLDNGNIFAIEEFINDDFLKNKKSKPEINKVLMAYYESFQKQYPATVIRLISNNAKNTNQFDDILPILFSNPKLQSKSILLEALIRQQISEKSLIVFFEYFDKNLSTWEEPDKQYNLTKFYESKYIVLLNNDLIKRFNQSEFNLSSNYVSAFRANNDFYNLENAIIGVQSLDKNKIMEYLNKTKDQDVIALFFEKFNKTLADGNFEIIKRFCLAYDGESLEKGNQLVLKAESKDITKKFLEQFVKLNNKERFEAIHHLLDELYENKKREDTSVADKKEGETYRHIHAKYNVLQTLTDKVDQKKKCEELIVQIDEFISKAKSETKKKNMKKFKEDLIKLKDQ